MHPKKTHRIVLQCARMSQSKIAAFKNIFVITRTIVPTGHNSRDLDLLKAILQKLQLNTPPPHIVVTRLMFASLPLPFSD